MPTGSAFESAAALVREFSECDVGVHLSLTGTNPVLSKREVRTLLNASGAFEDDIQRFLSRYLLGNVNKKEIYGEFRAQIEKATNSDIKLSHLDSHQHVHMLPGIFKIVVSLSKEYGIPFIRVSNIPINGYFFLCKGALSRKLVQLLFNLASIYYKRILRKEKIDACKHSFGFLESGRLNNVDLQKIMASLQEGQSELISHPGEVNAALEQLIGSWGYDWQKELECLNSENIEECARSLGVKLSTRKPSTEAIF